MHAKNAARDELYDEGPCEERPALELLVDLEARPTPEPRAEAGKAGLGAGPPVLAYGTALDGGELAVALDGGGPRPARRARSCLVPVTPGDRVLCSVSADAVYVLAVLESAGAGPTRVVADGALELQAGGEIALRGASLHMRARSATVAIEELKVLGRSVEATFAEKATLFAERVESRASRMLQRAKQAFRFVTELEQARVGNYDLRAESLAAVRGENTIVSARVLAKLDGEQVKIG
ncbi:DUF3540 domain-containing protein [Sorangium sp. So ce513]|uniref:DUF3540 domain-containing protein n=1 Tax=Sorangium sp. So ce513 TaxID=3133315 RepID=UPI003F5D7C35